MRELEYILVGQTPVPCDNTLEWANWFGNNDDARIVGKTEVGPYIVSTVFLGLNHNFWDQGPPILFETMIFIDGAALPFQERYVTWLEAEAGHKKAVELAELETMHPSKFRAKLADDMT